MLHKAKSWAGLSRTAKPPDADPDAALERLIELVPDATLDALVETRELPSREDRGRVEGCLRRFLAAEKYDVDKALTRLNKHAHWRKEYLGSKGVTEAEIREQLDSRKVLLQRPGAKGRPVLVIIGRNHTPGPSNADVERFVVYSLEAATALCDTTAANTDNKLYAIFDFKGLEIKNLDAAALRSCFSLLNAAYPERVLAVYMIDAPTIFWGLWKVVSPFIDPVSRKKVVFANGAAARAEFIEALGADTVPREYGGDAELTTVESVVAELREQDAKAAAAAAEVEAKAAANGKVAALEEALEVVALADGP